MEADVERCRTYAEATPQAATALNPRLGYERVAALVKESDKTGKSIRELVLEHDLVPEYEIDQALELMSLTRPMYPVEWWQTPYNAGTAPVAGAPSKRDGAENGRGS